MMTVMAVVMMAMAMVAMVAMMITATSAPLLEPIGSVTFRPWFNMTVSAETCARAMPMAAIERARVKHRAALAKLSARYRVSVERLRAAQRRDARQMIRKELAQKEKVKRTAQSAKVKTKVKQGRGRPARWPSLCHACMRRREHLAGGPKHMAYLCDRTQAYIKKLKVCGCGAWGS